MAESRRCRKYILEAKADLVCPVIEEEERSILTVVIIERQELPSADWGNFGITNLIILADRKKRRGQG